MIITDIRKDYFEGIEKYKKHLEESECSKPSILADFLFCCFLFVSFYVIYIILYSIS